MTSDLSKDIHFANVVRQPFVRFQDTKFLVILHLKAETTFQWCHSEHLSPQDLRQNRHCQSRRARMAPWLQRSHDAFCFQQHQPKGHPADSHMSAGKSHMPRRALDSLEYVGWKINLGNIFQRWLAIDSIKYVGWIKHLFFFPRDFFSMVASWSADFTLESRRIFLASGAEVLSLP